MYLSEVKVALFHHYKTISINKSKQIYFISDFVNVQFKLPIFKMPAFDQKQIAEFKEVSHPRSQALKNNIY